MLNVNHIMEGNGGKFLEERRILLGFKRFFKKFIINFIINQRDRHALHLHILMSYIRPTLNF